PRAAKGSVVKVGDPQPRRAATGHGRRGNGAESEGIRRQWPVCLKRADMAHLWIREPAAPPDSGEWSPMSLPDDSPAIHPAMTVEAPAQGRFRQCLRLSRLSIEQPGRALR